MHVLFIHRAFPAQFGRLGLELVQRYGWKCSFLFENLSSCPTPSPEMLQKCQLIPIPVSDEARANPLTPWPQSYGRYLDFGQSVFDVVRSRTDLRPDLIVGHEGLGPTLFLPEILHCPIINYCEYYFAPRRADLTYRIDLPITEPASFYPRIINAAALVELTTCDSGYSPTLWQKQSFPARFHSKIEVHFDGIDTTMYRPRVVPREIAGRTIPQETKIVTYVARGLESMRGFDLFLRAARRLYQEKPDVLFVVVGSEESYYGWDRLHTGQSSFKNWALQQEVYDLSRFIFLGTVSPDRLAEVLCLSDLHFYLSVPFVLSWSVLNAMACGCVVLGGDVPPVREVIEDGTHGLIAPLFDVDRLAREALRVLNKPSDFQPLALAARKLMEEKYSVDRAVPEFKDYFERVASIGKKHG